MSSFCYDSTPTKVDFSRFTSRASRKTVTRDSQSQIDFRHAADKAFKELKHPDLGSLSGDLYMTAHTIDSRTFGAKTSHYVPVHTFIDNFRLEQYDIDLSKFKRLENTPNAIPKPDPPCPTHELFYSHGIQEGSNVFEKDDIYKSPYFKYLLNEYYSGCPECVGVSMKPSRGSWSIVFHI